MTVGTSHEGHRLFETGDGLEGLEAARTAIPDLVIFDILMPSIDGFEFVRRLRADPQLHHGGAASLPWAHSIHAQAEGVESEEQPRFSRLLRCDQMQGCLICKPLSFADMTTWLGRSRGEQEAARRMS